MQMSASQAVGFPGACPAGANRNEACEFAIGVTMRSGGPIADGDPTDTRAGDRGHCPKWLGTATVSAMILRSRHCCRASLVQGIQKELPSVDAAEKSHQASAAVLLFESDSGGSSDLVLEPRSERKVL